MSYPSQHLWSDQGDIAIGSHELGDLALLRHVHFWTNTLAVCAQHHSVKAEHAQILKQQLQMGLLCFAFKASWALRWATDFSWSVTVLALKFELPVTKVLAFVYIVQTWPQPPICAIKCNTWRALHLPMGIVRVWLNINKPGPSSFPCILECANWLFFLILFPFGMGVLGVIGLRFTLSPLTLAIGFGKKPQHIGQIWF